MKAPKEETQYYEFLSGFMQTKITVLVGIVNVGIF